MATPSAAPAQKRPLLSEETLRELLALPDSELIALLTSHWQAALHEVCAEWQVTEKGSFWVDFRNRQGRRLFLPREAGRPMAVLHGAPMQPLVPGQYYQVAVQLSSLATRRKYRKPFALEVPTATVTVLSEAIQQVLQTAKEAEQIRRAQQEIESKTANDIAFSEEGNNLLHKRSTQVAPPREWRERKAEIVAALTKRSNLGDWGNQLASGLLGQVSARLATASDRMFWELLQNADDKPTTSKQRPPTATFHLLPNYLLFLHNGLPFSRADVEGIADATNGTKPEEENMTGYKGIGFKSVFATSRAVYVLSGGYSFRFKPEPDEDAATVPWMIWPRWTELAQYPEELLKHDAFFQSVASSVAIGLEMGSEQMGRYAELLPKTFAQPTFLLFLRAVRTVRVEGLPVSLHLRRVDLPKHRIELWTNQQKLTYWRQDFVVEVPTLVHEEAQQDKQMPPSLQRARQVKLTLAVPLTEAGPEAVAPADSILYCFLPTTDNGFALPALVNADFLTDPSREKVLPEKQWNNFLFEALGETWPQWLATILAEEPRWANVVYKLLPLCYTGKLDRNQEKFNEGLVRAVESTRFILTVDGQLVRPAEAILDRAELAEVLPELYKLNLLQGRRLVDPKAAKALQAAQVTLLGLTEIKLADVLKVLSQKTTAPGYDPDTAADLFAHLHEFATDAEVVKFKSVNWLFDQNSEPCSPTQTGLYGILTDAPDANFPFTSSLRWLHPQLDALIKTNGDYQTWVQQDLKLPPLTKAAMIGGVLRERIEKKKLTVADYEPVLDYLLQLKQSKEFDLIGGKEVTKLLPVQLQGWSAGTARAVGECHLPNAYTPDYELEDLSGVIAKPLSFASSDLLPAVSREEVKVLLLALGVRNSAEVAVLRDELVPQVQKGTLPIDKHEAVLQLLLRTYAKKGASAYPDELLASLGKLRINCKGRTAKPATECVFAGAYVATMRPAEKFVGMSEAVLPEYATKHGVDVTRDLFRKLGVRELPQEEALNRALGWLSKKVVGTLAESVEQLQELFGMHEQLKLTAEHRAHLNRLPLYLKDGTTRAACLCYLSSAYGPLGVDVEQLTGGQEQRVLSEAYLPAGADAGAWRDFLTNECGVKQTFTLTWYSQLKRNVALEAEDYWTWLTANRGFVTANAAHYLSNVGLLNNLELLEAPEVADKLPALLREQTGQDEDWPLTMYHTGVPAKVVPSAFVTRNTVLCTDGIVRPSNEVYSARLKGQVPRGASVARYQLGNEAAETYLGLHTVLTGDEALDVLQQQLQPMTRQDITAETLQEIGKLLDKALRWFDNEVELDDADEQAATLLLPTTSGEWTAAANLYWLDAPHMPLPNREDLLARLPNEAKLANRLRNLWAALGLPALTTEDFELTQADNVLSSSVLPSLLARERQCEVLKLLSWLQGQPQAESKWHERLARVKLVQVEDFQQICRDLPDWVVSAEDRFLVEENTFYFAENLWEGVHRQALGQFLCDQLSLLEGSLTLLLRLLEADSTAKRRRLVKSYRMELPQWLEELAPTDIEEDEKSIVSDSYEPDLIPTAITPPLQTQRSNGDGGAHALYNPGVSDGKRKDYQKEAREAAGPWLRQHGYTVDDNAHDDYSTFEPVIKIKEGTTWQVVVKSYRGGILYLNPNEWLTLASENSFLLLYKPRTGQVASEAMELINSLDEVHRRNPNVIVRLENTDAAGSVVNLTKLAEAYLFSKSFKFIFDSPSNEAFDFELAGNHTSVGPLPLDDLDIDLS